MIAERLMTANEYLPLLEEIGLQYIETIEICGVSHSVFQTPNGTRFIYPGARGCDDEIPMIPSRKLNDLIESATRVISKFN